MSLIEDNLRKINRRIAKTCEECGRDASEITLVGVTKTKSLELIKEAAQAGMTHLGENKVQEAERKIPRLDIGITWHMIGHLQTNKVKKAIQMFDIIESVDSIKLAETISRECVKNDIKLKLLLEVNSSGEESKYGLAPEKIPDVAEIVNKLNNVELCGLMTVGPLSDEIEAIDKAFELTQKLFLEMQRNSSERIKILSMGMTADFERAIKFGSTELRIGTAIFGPRNYN